ncbi:ROK family transcriptional regulator [Fusobacterium varium]|uniref:ROK family transcriptional regulator n=1 Tax=Fusobacterium varium TaxID=856 RepID=UPI0027DC0442|nr:ROK family transcriptional regulator [uncultured Fusobacterium sp.]
MKNKNDISILKLIQQKKAVSRIELANLIGVSQAAMSKRIKSLIEKGYLKENYQKNIKTNGRNAIGLEINPELGKVIGVYFGPEEISVVLSDINCNILYSKKEKIKKIKNIKEICFKIIDNLFSKEKILNIGVAMNGIVDIEKGISIYSASYNWNNINIKKELEERYKVPIFIENGVNLIALFEKYFGSCKDIKTFAVLNIGTGVKAGIYIENELYHGKDFGVGEIGHIPFDLSKEALICTCGNKGCIETLLADWRIEEKIFKITGKNYSYDEIIKKANNNERFFKDFFLNLLSVYLNIIFWIVTLINPEKIIIYGKINRCGDFFWRELKRKIKENSLNKNSNFTIERMNFDDKVIVQGAVVFALNNMF